MKHKKLLLLLFSISISILLGVTWLLLMSARAISCQSDGIGALSVSLRKYSSTHDGHIPNKMELEEWAKKNGVELPEGCSQGTFSWYSKSKYATGDVIVRCRHPHGFLMKYYNAITYPDLREHTIPYARAK